MKATTRLGQLAVNESLASVVQSVKAATQDIHADLAAPPGTYTALEFVDKLAKLRNHLNEVESKAGVVQHRTQPHAHAPCSGAAAR